MHRRAHSPATRIDSFSTQPNPSQIPHFSALTNRDDSNHTRVPLSTGRVQPFDSSSRLRASQSASGVFPSRSAIALTALSRSPVSDSPSHRELKDVEALLASHSVPLVQTANCDTRFENPYRPTGIVKQVQVDSPVNRPIVVQVGREDREVERIRYQSVRAPDTPESARRFPIFEIALPKQTHRTVSLPNNNVIAEPFITHNYETRFQSRKGDQNLAKRGALFAQFPSGKVSPYDENSSHIIDDSDLIYTDSPHTTVNSTRGTPAKHLLALLSQDVSDDEQSNDEHSHFRDEDDLIEGDSMPRTTDEWRSSFSAMRERFFAQENGHALDVPDRDFIFTTNGSLTLPRRGRGKGDVYKSASQQNIPTRRGDDVASGRSLLDKAIDRRAMEAPEMSRIFPSESRESPLGSFWIETMRNRCTSPIPTRGPLTAAQRLQQLQEPVEDGNAQTARRSQGENIAARRAHYLKEILRREDATDLGNFNATGRDSSAHRESTLTIDTRGNCKTPTGYSKGPNFISLDNVVAELASDQTTPGGCGRFPTGEMSVTSPARRARGFASQQHSPSPDTLSDASSSTFANPTGLPHPRPKHNIREQMLHAGIEPRLASRVGVGLYPRPGVALPIPANGSVALRVEQLEKRPGTPLLHIAGAVGNLLFDSHPRSPNGPLSPKSTVFRTKPIIHLEMRGSEHASAKAKVFDFSQPTITTLGSGHADSSMAMPAIQLSPACQSPMTKLADSLSRMHTTEPSPCTPSRTGATLSGPPSWTCAGSSRHPLHLPATIQQRRREVVPSFFFPNGKPISRMENDAALRRVSAVFSTLPNAQANLASIGAICRAAGLPLYWKRPVYDACIRNGQPRALVFQDFAQYWNRMTTCAHDEAARFVYTLAPSRSYLEKADFEAFLQDLIESFPGLHFLRDAPEFHSRYVQTVIVRIFWSVNRSWSGRITASELRRSNFLQTVRKLETIDDINKMNDYFSYEHFYVIYCKFWELDRDHNLVIDQIDMAQHANSALTPRIIERIFSGAVTRDRHASQSRTAVSSITYPDFVAFLLAEEDKKHPTSIEYWFRCLDLDGDGFISLYEMEYFYADVQRKMEAYGIDTMKFEDVACNLLDMVDPRIPNLVSLADLKRCAMSTRFFNAFVNWNKYYEQESTDGERATVKTDEDHELSDWDRFCAEEYEVLMADEQADADDADMYLSNGQSSMIDCRNLNLDDEDEIADDCTSLTVVGNSREMPLRRSPILEAL